MAEHPKPEFAISSPSLQLLSHRGHSSFHHCPKTSEEGGLLVLGAIFRKGKRACIYLTRCSQNSRIDDVAIKFFFFWGGRCCYIYMFLKMCAYTLP